MIFSTWRRGRALLHANFASDAISVEAFLRSTNNVTRVPATAIYLTSTKEGISPALLHNLKYNLVLHEKVLLVTVETAPTPRVDTESRLTSDDLGGAVRPQCANTTCMWSSMHGPQLRNCSWALIRGEDSDKASPTMSAKFGRVLVPRDQRVQDYRFRAR